MTSLWHSRTGFKEVDKTVLRIIHITWASAILPTICMVIAVGLYHAAPVRINNFTLNAGLVVSWLSTDQRMGDHLVLFFVLMTGKFYTFGMLRTLNSREKLRRRMQSRTLGRTSLTGWNRDQAARKHLSIQAPSMVRRISILLHGFVNPVLTLYKKVSRLRNQYGARWTCIKRRGGCHGTRVQQ